MKITMILNRVYAVGSQFGGTKYGVWYTAHHVGGDWFSYVDSHGRAVRLSGERLEKIFEIEYE